MLSAYTGPERRVHQVVLTQNTEYHLRRDLCVAVRDRLSGAWVENHAAINRRVLGSLEVLGHGGVKVAQGEPRVGACMCFDTQGLVTSRVQGISRPSKTIVEQHYSVVA